MEVKSVQPEVSVFGKVDGVRDAPEKEALLHMLGLRVDVNFLESSEPFGDTDSYYSNS